MVSLVLCNQIIDAGDRAIFRFAYYDLVTFTTEDAIIDQRKINEK